LFRVLAFSIVKKSVDFLVWVFSNLMSGWNLSWTINECNSIS
jgi:hypothetical protein